jgi:DnaK suppressor protein
VNKTTAKQATSAKAAAKKPAAKTVAHIAAKPPEAKSVPAKQTVKVAPETHHKPVAKPSTSHPTPAPAHPAPAARAIHHTSPATAAHTAGSKVASHPAAASPPAAVASPAVASQGSRFADRFSPAKPANRTMNHAITESPKPAHKADPRLVNAWKSKAGRDLTDDEVLAMPESEYMNDKQLEFFRTKLTALKDDLLSNAGETTEHLREDTSIVPDPADRATIEEEHALELRTRDRERKLLKKIGQSLARIDSGDYGFCDETGEPIGLGRLIARPTATLSLEAQQRRELKQKMFGD